MQLYGRVLSPFVMRPLLVAWAKGHELELAAAPDGLKSPAFLALNPIGKIPVLVDGDVVLPECQVIAEYLDAVLPGPATIAPDPAQAARERLLCRLADLYLMSEAQVLFGARENPGVVPAALEKLGLALGYIEHFRKAGDAFAAGDRFSIADAALIPIFFFLDVFAAQLPVAPLIAAQPGVAAWWATAKASPLGSRAVAAQQEDFGRMMAERAAAA